MTSDSTSGSPQDPPPLQPPPLEPQSTQPSPVQPAPAPEPTAPAPAAQPSAPPQPGHFGGAQAQTQYAPPPAAPAPGAVPAYGLTPAPAYAAPALAACPNCGQGVAGDAMTCRACGQVAGLPNGIVLSSVGKRFGEYLLEGLLCVCTLVIGWIIWSLIVWGQGQTPAKQLLGMRVVRLDTRTYAGWGKMFLREFVGKLVVGFVGSLLFYIGAIVADCWLLWDKDRQELWDKVAGTIVVNDPDKVLAATQQAA